jgi:hypothetical protein
MERTYLVDANRLLLVRCAQRDWWNDCASVGVRSRSGVNRVGGKVIVVVC